MYYEVYLSWLVCVCCSDGDTTRYYKVEHVVTPYSTTHYRVRVSLTGCGLDLVLWYCMYVCMYVLIVVPSVQGGWCTYHAGVCDRDAIYYFHVYW